MQIVEITSKVKSEVWKYRHKLTLEMSEDVVEVVGDLGGCMYAQLEPPLFFLPLVEADEVWVVSSRPDSPGSTMVSSSSSRSARVPSRSGVGTGKAESPPDE